MKPLRNIIFGGGGIRGVCYVGIFRYLEKYGLRENIQEVLGSSVGALFAVLFTIGYKSPELEELFRKKFTFQVLSDIQPEYFLDILDNFGLDSGENLERFIKIMCKVKTGDSDITLGTLFKLTGIHLRILSVNADKQHTVIFDHVSFPEVPVSLIVRMSMSFPIYYQPVKWNGSYYIDGDILQEYHLELFDSQETLLFLIDDLDHSLMNFIKGTPNKEILVKDFSRFIVKLILGVHLKNFCNNFNNFPEYQTRMIFIPIDHQHFFNFDITPDEILELVDIGFNEMEKQYQLIQDEDENRADGTEDNSKIEQTVGEHDTSRFFVGGNWKANPSRVLDAQSLLRDLVQMDIPDQIEVLIAPPTIYLEKTRNMLSSSFGVAAQNVSQEKECGSYTGEITANMLYNLNVSHVIIGHSERRALGEKNIGKKVGVALQSGLSVIFCCGESLEERKEEIMEKIVIEQLDVIPSYVPDNSWNRIIIAYEPVWAIGTGHVATPEDADNMCASIRRWLDDNVVGETNGTRVIYGGSVKGDNAEELARQNHINGFLVGGASLTSDFANIIKAGTKAGTIKTQDKHDNTSQNTKN